MNLTDICIRRPVLAWMLMSATVVFGAVAASRIGISQFPDVDFPIISIAVTWEGAAPEVMEHDVVDIIEEAVVQVEGVKSITSSSKQGSSTITVELDLSRNVDLALQDVQTKVSQAGQRLPKDIDPPVISKTNPEDQPIIWVGLSGPFSQQLLADTARYDLKEKLQTVPGVGEVTLGGYLERNVRIWVDARALEARHLTVTDVVSALRREHVELPAGRLETSGREVNVRVLGEALDLETLRGIIIKQGDSGPIHLSDVALVEDGFEDVRRVARVNGVPAQGMGIKKQRGTNAVAVGDGVKRVLAEIKPTLPPGMEVGIIFDSTKFIQESVSEIRWELLLSVLLTGLVCWMFLGSLSSTLNVLLAIPMSLLGTIAVIYFLGYTLNTFTLLALSLSVGIVVDDAIMVMENVHRHAESGKDKVRAASEGTKEITFAALAATLAVVAIFMPVVFMPGIVGRFFLQFGVTLSVAVLLSYLEAITLAPARLAQILHKKENRGWLGRKVDSGFDGLAHGYAWSLKKGLKYPVLMIVVAVAVFYGAMKSFAKLPKEFVPSQDQSRLLVRLQTAVGSDLTETDKLFKRAEAFVNNRPEVKTAFAVVGGFGGSGVNTGIMFVTLKEPGDRKLTQNEFAGVLRKELNSYPGLKAIPQDLSQSGFTAQRGFPVEFSVRGNDWDQLVHESQSIMQKLRESGTVVDVDSDYQLGQPELTIVPNRSLAADMGVSIDDIATTINALVGGVRVGKFSSGGRRIDVRLRLLADQRRRPEDISRLNVRTATGALIPLQQPLIKNDEHPALQSITRSDRQRAITVFASIAPGHSQNEAIALVERFGHEMPPGYHVVLGGASVAAKSSMSSLLFAFLLGILIAYMVLGAQFNSFLHPVTVLSILPIALAGGAFALLLGGMSVNIFSAIGFLLLVGIVKKNSIILVDYANQVRHEQNLDARAAMLLAGPVRLRPILMTSIATMMAALPSALGIGPGAEVRQPMAIAVVGGLVVSTVLSLLVVPAFYLCADWMLRVTKRGIGGLRRLFGRTAKHVEADPGPSP